MIGLGDLEGGYFHSIPTDMNAAGSAIVGWSRTALGEEAFIWQTGHGMRHLAEVLTVEYGVDLAGWTLMYAFAISGDGRVIGGEGVNPTGQHEVWAVYLDGLPRPRCPADFNNDDTLNSQDFFDFLVCFFDPPACPPLAADFNADGTIESGDFFDFLAAFFAGCP
jgi:hypothetical protein